MADNASTEQEFYDIRKDVLPIVVVSRVSGRVVPTVGGFRGTGFLVGRGLFVTCHHCVAEPLPEEDTYGVLTPIEYAPELQQEAPDAAFSVADLGAIEQDRSGLDLAIGWVGRDPVGIRLADEEVRLMGEDVRTFGYPLTEDLPHPEGPGRSLTLNGRVLKGYITTNYSNDVPGYRPALTDELDMPAPRGLSGAPVIRTVSREVVGMVYGTRDTGTVEEQSRVDEETGVRTPELQRLTTFAVSHMLSSLLQLRGGNTDDRPLGEYLRG